MTTLGAFALGVLATLAVEFIIVQTIAWIIRCRFE